MVGSQTDRERSVDAPFLLGNADAPPCAEVEEAVQLNAHSAGCPTVMVSEDRPSISTTITLRGGSRPLR